MASSNPFRKSIGPTTNAAEPGSTVARFPPLDAIDTSPAPPETSVSNKRSKIIKKVRVLSPPPLSPDSPEWPFTPPPLAQGLHQYKENDPFDAESSDTSDREIMPSATSPPPKEGNKIPANPFSKTLRDMETARPDQKLTKERREEGATLKVANKARRSLDVNSFKRLLMTGNLGADAASAQQSTPPTQKTDADSSSISLSSSSYDYSKDGLTTTQEVSLISHETSDTPDDDLDQGSLSDSSTSFQIGRGKKPPPPPSSRHGKSIKLELKSDGDPGLVLTPKSASDVNKPLPPAPRRSFENDSESLFERETANKVPEADVLFPSQNTPGSGKKAGPAPPPRRGHSRGESKSYVANNLKDGRPSKLYGDETPSRSSSIRSKTDRSRNEPYGLIPPPPPPRSHGSSRQSTIITPEVVASISVATNQTSTSPEPLTEIERPAVPQLVASNELSPPRNLQSAFPKMAAPPPPPTRNLSVRRPASIRSVDSSSRRTSAETKSHNGMAPPPPPRRQRGSSQTSMDGPYGRTSLDGVPKTEQRVTEESGTALNIPGVRNDFAPSQSGTRKGNGVDILADLTALQREVDALRGKLGS